LNYDSKDGSIQPNSGHKCQAEGLKTEVTFSQSKKQRRNTEGDFPEALRRRF
jgi:hypothetical protein